MTIQELCAAVNVMGGWVEAVFDDGTTLTAKTWDTCPFADGFYYIKEEYENLYTCQKWFHGPTHFDGDKLIVDWRPDIKASLQLLESKLGKAEYAKAVEHHKRVLAEMDPKEIEYRKWQIERAPTVNSK